MGVVYRNGRPYAYRSKRVGGRVVCEYMGSGKLAALRAERDQFFHDITATLSTLENGHWRDVEDEANEVDQELARLTSQALGAATVLLERSGYHRHHRGQWRKRRAQRTHSAAEEAPCSDTGQDHGRLGGKVRHRDGDRAGNQ